VQHVGPGDASFDVAVYPNLELDDGEFPSDVELVFVSDYRQ
jgi:hypothetical protein